MLCEIVYSGHSAFAEHQRAENIAGMAVTNTSYELPTNISATQVSYWDGGNGIFIFGEIACYVLAGLVALIIAYHLIKLVHQCYDNKE